MLVYFFTMERITPPLNEYEHLERMLALRSLRWSYTELAREFAVPKTTIRYLVRRFGLNGKYKPPIAGVRTTSKYAHILYARDKINPGKTYAEYLKEDRERQWRSRLNTKQPL